jgi:hypothetical protein
VVSDDAAKIEVPKAGTIKRIYVRQNVPAGNAGSAENVTHKVCVNSGTNCFGTRRLHTTVYQRREQTSH